MAYSDFTLAKAKAKATFGLTSKEGIVEAKREDIIGGLGQCVAALVAAQQFNEGKGQPIPKIYGAVTSGTNWRFLMLEETRVSIDSPEYYISQVDRILGILLLPFQSTFLVGSPNA